MFSDRPSYDPPDGQMPIHRPAASVLRPFILSEAKDLRITGFVSPRGYSCSSRIRSVSDVYLRLSCALSIIICTVSPLPRITTQDFARVTAV